MKKELKTVSVVLLSSTLSALAAVGIYDYSSSRGDMHGLFENHPVSTNAVFDQPRMTPASYRSASTPEDFVEVAERSINGVVNIRAEQKVQRSSRRGPFFDPFEFFFGPQGGFEGQQRSMPQMNTTIGSGVIISTDGYIITNNHVVEGTDKLTVSTNDNREFDAKVIGTDPATDIALLKIEAKGLQPLPFGDSEALRVGEWVLAIGNPFNLSSTVTAGIVSAKGRSAAQGTLQVASFIQTDAAVNPGNSGGALVNTRGELVGINTMIYSQTGNYAGYSFAVPVSIAAKVVEDIKKYGTVQRAQLGIAGTNITSDLTKEFDLKVTEGAVVMDFAERSSAKQVGLEKGDVITGVSGVRIRSMAELQEQIGKYRPGDKVKLTVNRKGNEKTYEIVLKNSEGTTDVVKGMAVQASDLGATFKQLDSAKRKHLGVNLGVEVTSVSNGRLKEAGVPKGFIILTINDMPIREVSDIDQVIRAVSRSNADKVLIVKGVFPNGRGKYYVVELN